jgi:hypothetical protein
LYEKGGAFMSRVSEVTALQQQRVKEMQERMKNHDLSDDKVNQLMIQNMTQTLNDISATLAIISDKYTERKL